MYCINCGKEFNLEKLSCPYCQFSIFDAQKILIEKIQEKETSNIIRTNSSNEEVNSKIENEDHQNWTCYFCKKENKYDDHFCTCETCGKAKKETIQKIKEIAANGLSNDEIINNNIVKPLPDDSGKTWVCSRCSTVNPFSQYKCSGCSMLKVNNFEKDEKEKDEKEKDWSKIIGVFVLIAIGFVLLVGLSL